MSYLEETLLRHVSGARIMVGSFVIGFGGVLPLLLYMALGPADGIPLGLGLLAMVTVPVGGVGLVMGLIATLARKFDRRGE